MRLLYAHPHQRQVLTLTRIRQVLIIRGKATALHPPHSCRQVALCELELCLRCFPLRYPLGSEVPVLVVSALDTAINFVSNQRGSLGAAQNRLEHTINYLGVANQNLASSESLIRNADVAAETAELTRDQIMQQAAMAVLAQANQAPQAALQLLR